MNAMDTAITKLQTWFTMTFQVKKSEFFKAVQIALEKSPKQLEQFDPMKNWEKKILIHHDTLFVQYSQYFSSAEITPLSQCPDWNIPIKVPWGKKTKKSLPSEKQIKVILPGKNIFP